MHRALTPPVQQRLTSAMTRRGGTGDSDPRGAACGEWRQQRQGGPVASKDQARVAPWATGADVSQRSWIGTRLYFAPLGPRGPC